MTTNTSAARPSTAKPSAARPSALLPISVSHQGQRIDLAVPGSIPLAELLPGMVKALGRLNAPAATQGFRLILADGSELDPSASLTDQHVGAGTVLTLEAAGAAAEDLRYDDLVEAIGVAVESDRRAWNPESSVQLSAYSAAGLFAVAALLLILRGDQPILTAALAGVGALLVCLATVVLVRISAIGGAVALAVTVPILTAAIGYAATSSTDFQLTGAGMGAAIGSLAFVLLPPRHRSVVVGPLLIAAALIVHGSLTVFAAVPAQRSAAIVVALVTVLVFAAPWIGLAQMPARIEGLRLTSTNRVDPREVARQVGNADVQVLTLRVSTGLITVTFAPAVSTDLLGAVLMTCIGLAAMLATRSLYSRAEVLVSMISGLATVLAAGAAVGLSRPDLAWWLATTISIVGAFVLAWNVVSPKWRPWLNRLANGVQVICLMAIPPLTLWVLGVI